MPPTGYPDYQRVTFDAGNQFYNVNAPITATGYVMPITPCSNWESVSVYCGVPAGGDYYEILCVFFTDPAGGQIVSQPSFVVGPSFRVVKSLPVEGPYFALFVNVKAGGNNTAVGLTAYGGAANVSSITWDYLHAPIMAIDDNLAPNASSIYSPTTGTHGPATVAFDTSNTKNFRCAILYYDWVQSKFINLYLFYGADIGRGAIVHVDLPLTPLKFYAQNTDAAAQNIRMFCVPGIPGGQA